MKERRTTDNQGNVYIQQWADADYPAQLNNEDSMNAFLVGAYPELRQYRDTPNAQFTVLVLTQAVKLCIRCCLTLIRLYRRDLEAID